MSLIYNILKSPNELKPHPENLSIYSEEEADEKLVLSIRDKGMLEPIAIRDDNTILSGHRRWLAAKQLKLDKVPCRSISFKNELDELEALIEFNRQREKTITQRMKEKDKLMWIETERARARHLEGVKRGAETVNNGQCNVSQYVATLPPSEECETVVRCPDDNSLEKRNDFERMQNESWQRHRENTKNSLPVRDIVAEKIGMKPRTFDKVAKVWDLAKLGDTKAQDLMKKLDAGEVTVNRAYNEIKQKEQEKEPVVDVPLPDGKFRCIVIDPPWDVKKILRDERPNQAEFAYKTMSDDEISELPVSELADNDCHLYLWTTHKKLPTALKLAEKWGFNYQCLMTWVKNVGFTPFSWMYSTEHVLFCRKGKLELLQKGMRLDFNAKVREHSRKPDEFYSLIVKASPEPRLDMFSRETRDGFEHWGNETGKFTPEVV